MFYDVGTGAGQSDKSSSHEFLRAPDGRGLLAEVLAAQPDASIWNTDLLGTPAVLALAHAVYVDAGAEAVICISNRQVTRQVVGGLEQRRIPAFGPIWDS